MILSCKYDQFVLCKQATLKHARKNKNKKKTNTFKV